MLVLASGKRTSAALRSAAGRSFVASGLICLRRFLLLSFGSYVPAPGRLAPPSSGPAHPEFSYGAPSSLTSSGNFRVLALAGLKVTRKHRERMAIPALLTGYPYRTLAGGQRRRLGSAKHRSSAPGRAGGPSRSWSLAVHGSQGVQAGPADEAGLGK